MASSGRCPALSPGTIGDIAQATVRDGSLRSSPHVTVDLPEAGRTLSDLHRSAGLVKRSM
jgi:hypothetical protein